MSQNCFSNYILHITRTIILSKNPFTLFPFSSTFLDTLLFTSKNPTDLFQFLRFTRLRNMDRPVFSKSFHLSFSKYFLHRSSPFIPNVTKPIPLAKIHLLRLLVVKKRRFQSHSLFEPEPHARHTCHDTYFLPPFLPPARSPEHLSDTRTPTRVGKGLESWVYTMV